MANVTTGRCLYFDSTSGATITKLIRIIGIYWTSNEGAGLDIAADDDFLCRDNKDVTILCKRAEGAGDGLEVTFSLPGVPFDGFEIPTMDGGVCVVLCAHEV